MAQKRKMPSSFKVGARVKRRKTTPYTRPTVAPLKAEIKFFDTAVSTNLLAAGAIVPSLNIIPEGDGESARDGRKIRLTKLDIHGRVFYDASVSTDDGDVGRIIVYEDKQTNKAAAAVTDILETADVNAFRNLANVKRFNILSDQQIAMNTPVAGADQRMWYNFHKSLNIPVSYDNTAATGAITTQTSSNVGMLLISQFDNVLILQANARMRFVD